jgi:hypothetical protein
MKKIKWILVNKNGKEIPQIQEATVPEEVLLSQFWAEITKVKIPTASSSRVPWGRKFGNGHEIGHGPLVTIRKGDLLHIEIQEQRKVMLKEGKMNVDYVVGSQSHTLVIKGSETIVQLLGRIRKGHPQLTIERIKLEKTELEKAQRVSEIRGQRVYAVVSPLVEVTILFKGRERRMAATASWTQEQFVQAAKGCHEIKKGNYIARRVGAEEEQWEIRAGHVYEFLDTAPSKIRISRKGEKIF